MAFNKKEFQDFLQNLESANLQVLAKGLVPFLFDELESVEPAALSSIEAGLRLMFQPKLQGILDGAIEKLVPPAQA